jgi:nucleotide-binding universal stress UspA family protein
MNANSTILVGVSGSPASLAALQWAADEAERRGCRLRVVLICEREQRASYAQQADLVDGTERKEQARRVLTTTVRAVLGSGPWRNATVEAVEGRVEQALVAASADADLLVLGSGPAAMIGPVTRTCLTDAHCPVVVVNQAARMTSVVRSDEKQRAHEEAARRRDDGRVPLPAAAASGARG